MEQSKKLIKLGLNPKSSDMRHVFCVTLMTKDIYQDIYQLEIGGESESNEKYYIPAWSLSALLGLMPKLYELEDDPNDGGCQPNLCKGWDNNQWHIVYRSSIYITEWYDDPIDAAFEMVCWLKDQEII